MARGRTATPSAESAVVEVDTEALAHAGHALAVVSAEQLQVQQYLGLQSMDPETLIPEVSLWLDHSARAMFEVGRRLIALRSLDVRGSFLQQLDRIGIAPRTAQKMMQATNRCLKSQLKLDKILQLDRSKVIELVSLDDETLENFESTGKLKLPGLAGQLVLDLDDIDSASVSELRKMVREHKQTIAAKDKVLAKKDAKLNELAEKLERPFQPDEDSVARTAEEAALLGQIRDVVASAEAQFSNLAHLVDAAVGLDVEAMRLAAHTAMQYLVQRAADICGTHAIPVDLDAAVVPEWIARAHAAKGKKAKA